MLYSLKQIVSGVAPSSVRLAMNNIFYQITNIRNRSLFKIILENDKQYFYIELQLFIVVHIEGSPTPGLATFINSYLRASGHSGI